MKKKMEYFKQAGRKMMKIRNERAKKEARKLPTRKKNSKNKKISVELVKMISDFKLSEN
jgi:hypothetical protein